MYDYLNSCIKYKWYEINNVETTLLTKYNLTKYRITDELI